MVQLPEVQMRSCRRLLSSVVLGMTTGALTYPVFLTLCSFVGGSLLDAIPRVWVVALLGALVGVVSGIVVCLSRWQHAAVISMVTIVGAVGFAVYFTFGLDGRARFVEDWLATCIVAALIALVIVKSLQYSIRVQQ